MKQFIAVILTTVLVISAIVPTFATGSTLLSPALKILAEDTKMIRSGLVTGEIDFTATDFDRAVGRDVNSITITALPPATDGVLMYNNAPVTVNQTISEAGLEYLYFVPTSSCETSSFRFRAGDYYSIECVLKYTDSVNLAPSVSTVDTAIPVWTQKDIAVFGTLDANDAEGDSLTFEIVDYPRRGIIEILNKNSGDYRYTPYDGLVGEDSFSYAVFDEWGNYSEVKTVSVSIDNAEAELVFADLDGHWAHNAAIVMVASDAMSVRSVNGEMYFDPDEKISREDFLVTVMKVLGAGEIAPAATVFADDDEISESASGYVARAQSLGIIKGSRENGLLYFNPKDNITRAEAAVILNAIIGAEESDVVPVFADASNVPAWAKSSIYALTSAGVFNGTGNRNFSANDTVSRAEVAQMLLTVKKIYVD
ncbi:MAG: S-layer homology domain-containing protein [Ruminococcaceae bacterium]|nr:S-layer homology domain-containing protein [Oscillospiraceae bacterium]